MPIGPLQALGQLRQQKLLDPCQTALKLLHLLCSGCELQVSIDSSGVLVASAIESTLIGSRCREAKFSPHPEVSTKLPALFYAFPRWDLCDLICSSLLSRLLICPPFTLYLCI